VVEVVQSLSKFIEHDLPYMDLAVEAVEASDLLDHRDQLLPLLAGQPLAEDPDRILTTPVKTLGFALMVGHER